MPISVSTDPIRPAERQAFWTEAICRSFAHSRPGRSVRRVVSGHFEFVELGSVKLVRFESAARNATAAMPKLVSKAGSDEFMFDFQRRGRSSMAQAGNEGTIEPGYGVLYDARRPFEDRLDGPEQRSEVLIATVPAATLLRMFPQAERLCARPVPLSGAIARSIAAFVRSANPCCRMTRPGRRNDIVAYLSTLLRLARGDDHGLSRSSLFGLIDTYLRANIAAIRPARRLQPPSAFRSGPCTRVCRPRTTFERHVLQLRVEHFPGPAAATCPVGDFYCRARDAMRICRRRARHQDFKNFFGVTPRDFRGGQLPVQNG